MSKKQKVYEAQEELEAQHRAEEDILLEAFKQDREQRDAELRALAEMEWEERLKDLTAKFDLDMSKKSKKLKGAERKVGLINVIITGSS